MGFYPDLDPLNLCLDLYLLNLCHFSYELHMRQIHSEKGGFAVCEYCSKEFTGSIGKVKFALKEHIQVGKAEILRCAHC